MKNTNRDKAILMLEDGSFFTGLSIGKKGTTGGEICFNTGMTGYQEIYTDPSYYGQIIVNTNAHIGNYGVHQHEVESENPKISGLVVNDFSLIHSRFSGSGSLQSYLDGNNVVGISDVDTRRIVRYIRDKGAMNAIISSEITDIDELREKVKELPSMKGLELSSRVSTKEPYFVGEPENYKYKVAVLDLGVKKSILSNLTHRKCYCKVFPARTSFEQIMEWEPDGFFVSNGPGDPAAMDYAFETVRKMADTGKPLFGICLGHQVLAMAYGISTYKMHHGHRGINHPIKNLQTGKCEITSQNHGFCVSRSDIEASAQVIETHTNLNDKTVAGIKIKNTRAFSVQYHPEASPGPHDSRYLFDNYIDLFSSN